MQNQHENECFFVSLANGDLVKVKHYVSVLGINRRFTAGTLLLLDTMYVWNGTMLPKGAHPHCLWVVVTDHFSKNKLNIFYHF